jgi:S1-C subfamily serine protease
VVAGADEIEVTFADGTMVNAELIGADPDSDLAVLKVDRPADELHPVRVADSTQVQVGDLAIAIGHPFGLESTMTVGFISGLGRSLPAAAEMGQPTYTIPDIIQTDAPINPGNSGGVLVDDQGAVVGVTAAIASPVRASAGVGFVIPAAIVEKVVPVLIEDGAYVHPWLGLSGTTLDADLAEAMDLDTDQRGALVISIVPEGPADAAGLRGSDQEATVDGRTVQVGGDVIVAIEGEPVSSFGDVVAYLARATEAGDEVTLTVLRDGEEASVEVTLGARPGAESTPEPTQGEVGQGTWLGITGMTLVPELAEAMDLSADQSGVLVHQVAPGGPADGADLRGSDEAATVQGQQVPVGGDVIVAWNGETVANFEELKALVDAAEPGDEVTLTVLRDGEPVNVTVTLAARPAA